jgi:signal transduction histidine kinase
VRFDDRLLTVLNQPAGDRHDAAVRWRQLVDLVARAGPHGASPVVIDALESIRAEAPQVDEQLRAAAARAVAALPLPLGLLEYFAADRLSVSAPVLAAATLDAAQWQSLLKVSDPETRRFIETLHPDATTGIAADATEMLVEPAAPEPAAQPAAPAPLPPSPSLHDVVARIERRRKSRGLMAGEGRSAAPVAPGAPNLFRWECGPNGEIAWIEGAPRGALIGRSIARPQEISGDRLDVDVVRAFAMRAPFRDGQMVIGGEGMAAGDWRISGVPAFDPGDGRFAGYRGVALRQAPPQVPIGTVEMIADPDSLRELVHEVKTPLNAIVGFAEIIDGQLLGPADRRYRDRAGEIVGQAQLLLGAIDDLDFAAKVHSGRATSSERVDLAELLERTADSLRQKAAERGVELEVSRPQRIAPAAVEPELADRLIDRLCGIAIDLAQPGERIRLAVDEAGGHCRFSVSRPAALMGAVERALFDPSFANDDPAVAAAGFVLRLTRGLARIAGGDLAASAAGFALQFPRA